MRLSRNLWEMDTIRFASWSVIAALQSQRNKEKKKIQKTTQTCCQCIAFSLSPQTYMFLPNQQRWQMIFHKYKELQYEWGRVYPHLCIRWTSQYSLVNAILTKLTTKISHQKSLPVTRQRVENIRTRKIWRRPNKDNKQFPYWFCMTLSDAQRLWLSFSC